MSPPPPAEPPPAIVVTMVFSATVSGSIDAFNRSAYRASLSALLNVAESFITLNVTAGSVIVTAHIDIVTVEAADRVAGALDASAAQLSNSLGVVVESFNVARIIPPTSPLASPDFPPPPGQSPRIPLPPPPSSSPPSPGRQAASNSPPALPTMPTVSPMVLPLPASGNTTNQALSTDEGSNNQSQMLVIAGAGGGTCALLLLVVCGLGFALYRRRRAQGDEQVVATRVSMATEMGKLQTHAHKEDPGAGAKKVLEMPLPVGELDIHLDVPGTPPSQAAVPAEPAILLPRPPVPATEGIAIAPAQASVPAASSDQPAIAPQGMAPPGEGVAIQTEKAPSAHPALGSVSMSAPGVLRPEWQTLSVKRLSFSSPTEERTSGGSSADALAAEQIAGDVDIKIQRARSARTSSRMKARAVARAQRMSQSSDSMAETEQQGRSDGSWSNVGDDVRYARSSAAATAGDAEGVAGAPGSEEPVADDEVLRI